jgi:hypothetical protein
MHAPGKADLNLYAYVHGSVFKNTDPMGLDDEPQQATKTYEPSKDSTETNTVITFSDATIHAMPPKAAVSDEDKIADGLGVPRGAGQSGPSNDVVDRARMALPTNLRTDKTLRPVLGAADVQGWTTRSEGVTSLYSPDGDRNGYPGAGEKPLVSTPSPIDVAAPMAARGLWMLGGRALQVASTARGAVQEIATAGGSIGRVAPFNPSGSLSNCVNGVCAFLNSVKNGSLETASADVAWNGGSIARANAQILDATGARMGAMQSGTLNTARARQFFVVYPGTSARTAEHVLVGINNGGKSMLYDPQIGAKIFDVRSFGPFVAFPVAF